MKKYLLSFLAFTLLVVVGVNVERAQGARTDDSGMTKREVSGTIYSVLDQNNQGILCWENNSCDLGSPTNSFGNAYITTTTIGGVITGTTTFNPAIIINSDGNTSTTFPLVINNSTPTEIFSVNGVGDLMLAGSLNLGGDGTFGNITIETDETEAQLNFVSNRATPTADNPIATFNYNSQDSNGNDTLYAYITGEIKDPTDTIEDGRLDIGVVHDGVTSTGMFMQGVGGVVQVQFPGDVNFQSRMSFGDDVPMTAGASGDFFQEFDTGQTNDAFLTKMGYTSKTWIIGDASTGYNHQIPNQSHGTIVMVSDTRDPADSPNAWAGFQYDGNNLKFLGAEQATTTGASPTTINNGFLFNPQKIQDTEAAGESFGLKKIREINDPNVASGDDIYPNDWSVINITDDTGTDEVYHYLATTDGSDVFSVADDGAVGINTSTPIGFLYINDDNAPDTDTVTILHGSNGNPDTTGTNAMDVTGNYSGNINASTVTFTLDSEGFTTQGNFGVAASASVDPSSSDAVGTFVGGYSADLKNTDGSAAKAAFISLNVTSDWEKDFISVNKDNVISAVAVAPGDGWNVNLVGGDAITGGSAQDGGDVILEGGSEAGGGNDGKIGVETTSGAMKSSFEVSGSIGKQVTFVDAATYTIDETSDSLVFVNYTDTGTVTVTLPAASDCYNTSDDVGCVFTVKDGKANAGTNNISVIRAGSDVLIDTTTTSATSTIATDGGALVFQTVSTSAWAVY